MNTLLEVSDEVLDLVVGGDTTQLPTAGGN